MQYTELLAGLEMLRYSDRFKRMVALGRQAAQDPACAALLDRLEMGSTYERMLVLMSCAGSRDGDRAARALRDRSGVVRALARRMAPRLCTDDQLHQALEQSPRLERQPLLLRLHRARRLAPIDKLLEAMIGAKDPESGDVEAMTATDPEASEVLPFASPAAIDRLLPSCYEGLRLIDLERLARRAPDHAFAALMARLPPESAESRPPDFALQARANVTLRCLARQNPDQGLELLRALAARRLLRGLELTPVVKRRPLEAAEILLESGESIEHAFAPYLARLREDQLLRLEQRRPGLVAGSTAFAELPPTVRLRLYALSGAAWRDAEGRLPLTLLEAIPGETRVLEARRHLALPVLATRPIERMAYARFLPWIEARAQLEPMLGSPVPEERVAAWTAIVGAARFDRDRLGELLVLLKSRRFEQDPVRLAMFQALVVLPPARWLEAHLEDLGQLLRYALDAADLSVTTVGYAQQLVMRVFPFHRNWSIRWLETTLRERGGLGMRSLEPATRNRDAEAIEAALLPVLRSWTDRERRYQLRTFGSMLGRRLRRMEGVQALLEQLLRDALDQWDASGLLDLLRAHAPARLARLIPELLEADESFVVLQPVYEHLNRTRQDLLRPVFLGRRAWKGRFGTGKNRTLLPFQQGFSRWSPDQQATFLATLEEMAHPSDDMREAGAVQDALSRSAGLAYVPELVVDLLSRAARDPRQPVRQWAIQMLGRLDAAAGVPRLLDALEASEEARVAIYALRSALLAMPAEAALEVVVKVPLGRVTVAKEVVRLLGDLRTESAYARLVGLADGELHRDVRVAVLRGLWTHLERAPTWPILMRFALDPDPAYASVLLRTPVDGRSEGARARMRALFLNLLEHPVPAVRVEALGRAGGLPVPDPERRLIGRLLELAGSTLPDERRAAGRAAFARIGRADLPALEEALEPLMRDRRALAELVDAVKEAWAGDRSRMTPVLEAVLARLEQDPKTVALQARLLPALPFPTIEAALARLEADGQLGIDGLPALAGVFEAALRTAAPDGLEATERWLAGQEAPALRWLGIAALRALARTPGGWSAERRARLEAYREDRDRVVSASADLVFPPEEGEEPGNGRG